jgi:hypothetical protein
MTLNPRYATLIRKASAARTIGMDQDPASIPG